jgi:LacI family transcriptional regulator
MPRITLQDIAYKLNISVSTVSKALKGYPDVSKKTKKAVVELAEKLNFTPNIVASNLRTQDTKIIGVIVPKIVHHFFSNVIDGMINVAEKNGYMVLLLLSNENYELEQKQINLLIKQQVDGILISLTSHTKNFDHLKQLQSRGIPLVMYDKVSNEINCSKVIIDDSKAAFDAVSYLLSKGHKKIAFFGGSLLAQNFNDRFLGYKKALKEYRIPFDERLVYVCDSGDEFNDGLNYAEEMLTTHTKSGIDAVFSVTDLMAVGINKYLRSVNISVPNEIAIFGFSNWFLSSIMTPSLSTVNQPGKEMGIKSVELLLEEIALSKAKKTIIVKQIILPTTLEIRESTN